MRKNRIIVILAALCVFSLAAMVLALSRVQKAAEFTPPPFEPASEYGMPDVPEGLGYQELDVQVYRVWLCGEVHVRDSAAQVWFANPESNTLWLKLRVLDEEGRILGQTGILRPGEYVRQVVLSETGQGTAVTLKVMAYEPDTYHSAGALVFHTRIAAE